MPQHRFDTIKENATLYRQRWNFAAQDPIERLTDAYVHGATDALVYSSSMVEEAARTLLSEHLPGWDEPGNDSGGDKLLEAYMRDIEVVFQAAGMMPENSKTTILQ